MFIKRTISGVVLVALAILVLYIGGPVLIGTLLLVSMIGTFELLRAVKLEKAHIGFVCYVAVISYYILLYFKRQDLLVFMFVITFLLLLTFYVFSYPKYNVENVAMIFFVIIYAGILMSYVYQVRILEDGKILVWLILASAWGSDTCAYLTGMLIGKHRLPSELSPKKTIEGCVGGVVGAALIGFLLSFLYPESDLFYLHPGVVFAIVGALGSVISQIGDLTASAIKRNHNLKDYGNIIPGHGGILDRFDSIIFVAPVVYYLLVGLSTIKF